jgi:lysophospholipase L1-like esterase
MATYATLTVPVLDIIGAEFNASRASVWIEPNVPLVIADSIRVGGRREQVVNGVATFTNLVTTNSADNPTSFGYRVTITAPPKGAAGRKDIVTLTTSDFPLTASANLKDISAAWDNIAIPPNWQSDFRDEMGGVLDAAEAARDLAIDISNIDTSDEAINVALQLPGGLAAARIKAEIGGPASTQVVMRKLAHGEDARITVLSDSTANSSNEWPYLLAQKLAADWPTHTVRWFPADTTDNIGYDVAASVTVQTGTAGGSSPVLYVWNYSIAGRAAVDWQTPTFFNPAVQSVNPDLVIIAGGHNDGTFTPDNNSLGNPREQFRLRYLHVGERVRQVLPDAEVVLVAQNPWQDGTGDMDAKRDELRTLAAARGYGFIDVFQAWADDPAKSTYYLDNIHPNAGGQSLYADTIHRPFVYTPRLDPRPAPPSLFDQTGVSVADPLVMASGATVPLGWTADNATVTRDTGYYESGTYGVRVQRTTPGSPSRIYKQVLTATQAKAFRNRWITVAVLCRRPVAGIDNMSVGQVTVTDGVATSRTMVDDTGYGGFGWRFLPHLVDVTSTGGITVSLWSDLNSSAPDADVVWDKFYVFPGQWPFGNAVSSDAMLETLRALSLELGGTTATTAPAIRLDAAAGVERQINFLAGGVNRWLIGARLAETGSNVGSDIQFIPRSDAGAGLPTALTLVRSTSAVRLGVYMTGASYSTAGRPSAATAGLSAYIYDTTLKKPLWSDGTNWRDAAGTVA